MGKLILVVDDDPDIREILQSLLEDEDYLVEVASDGEAALQKMESGLRPHLILLDLLMPRMDGMTFVQEIQNRNLRHSLPIILLSAHARSKEHLGKIHLDGFMNKPFDINALLALISTLINRS
ncbi:response regulator [Tengunoibacter tsumagoiensis]|uniref:Response regulatory domain-containing protein n=1 Tax=Tengunoibacter tsumagoiensis TaxID=2014871 RepID=A0A401ZXE6_9CHLR|nr:response regulator [Tengunoibacter tsumagoiensis]GCE11528.1 hypothetical protein KTT_13870 [Tengunoibacter tsumagoiensis]